MIGARKVARRPVAAESKRASLASGTPASFSRTANHFSNFPGEQRFE